MPDIQDHFRGLCGKLVSRNLRPLSLTLGILCVGFALWSLGLPSTPQIPPLINQAAFTSVLLVGIRVLLQFWQPSERWAHPFAVLCLGLGLLNLLLCQYSIPGPGTLPWLVMWIVSAGFLLLSWSWFIVTLLLALIGAALAWSFPATGAWSYGLTLLTATALAGAIHASRWGTVRQQAIQEADDEDQRKQAAIASQPEKQRREDRESLAAERQAARSEVEQLRQSLEESRRILELRQAELDATLHESTQAKKALEIASRVKETFLAIVSHELRTPMNGILGMASLLETAGLPLAQHQNVVAVRTSAESLLRTINEILEFSELESGQAVLSSVPFSVYSLLRDVTGGLTAQARGKKNRILYDVSPAVPELIEGDAERLRQLLAILIGNAVKFTQQGEISIHVTREVEEDPQQVRLKFAVGDTGIGMPEESRQRLFQPFTQMDDSASRKFGGTGMGLAIAKQIANLFHGTIGVESTPNQGSIFWVVLSFKNLVRLPRSHA